MDSKPANDLLIAWLNDAHAMESALIPVLESHARGAKDPLLRGRIERHLQDTRGHAEAIKGCLQRLGETPSTIKTALGKVVGFFQGAATGVFPDEGVKNVISDYTAENFEIACYVGLIEAATRLGLDDVASTCRKILVEEEDMARWLIGQVPAAVGEALLQKTTA